jgi:hypothetical protein
MHPKPTPKYLAESISIATYNELTTAIVPPREYIFEEAIIKKLKIVSYQEPNKVAEGLSYIWDEKFKWQKISQLMAMEEKTVKTTLKLIADRRNIIVHEADINPLTEQKYEVSNNECSSFTDFLCLCGESIVNLVAQQQD